MTELEEALRTPEELLETLAPRVESLDMLLEYPREVVERFLYEREGYWTKILSPEDRIAMVDYVRQISFGLAWDIYSQDEYGVMPVETRRAISLHGFLEYCSGIFRQLARLVQLIDRSPNQQLTREKVFVDFSMSRKAGPGSINWLMSHPRSHRFAKAAPNSSLAPNLRGSSPEEIKTVSRWSISLPRFRRPMFRWTTTPTRTGSFVGSSPRCTGT